MNNMIHGSPEERPSAKGIINQIRNFAVPINFQLLEKVYNDNIDYEGVRFSKLDHPLRLVNIDSIKNTKYNKQQKFSKRHSTDSSCNIS